MKKFILICCLCVLLTTAVSQARVIPTMTITFDENGKGDIDGTSLLSGVGPLPGQIPGHATLFYELPVFSAPVEGDVVIYEPDALGNPTSIISDILRFDAATIPCVFVYSEKEAGEQPPYDLADTGIPTEWINVVRVPEVGSEGWNGIHYTPGLNDPGYIAGVQVTYIFTSDVPEPATICILSLGALSLIRRKK